MKKIIILCSVISALFFVSCDLTGAKITQQFVPETLSEIEEVETPSETTETEEEPEPVPYITIYNPLDVEVFFELKEVTGSVKGNFYVANIKSKRDINPSIAGSIKPGETYLIFSHPSENYLYIFEYCCDNEGSPICSSFVIKYSSIQFDPIEEGTLSYTETNGSNRLY